MEPVVLAELDNSDMIGVELFPLLMKIHLPFGYHWVRKVWIQKVRAPCQPCVQNPGVSGPRKARFEPSTKLVPCED
jgi:hypothetical protein